MSSSQLSAVSCQLSPALLDRPFVKGPLVWAFQTFRPPPPSKPVDVMSELLRDVRHALRAFAKAKGFTVAALLTLALGIGANTAIFSIVNGVLLRPLPYDQPDRLVALNHYYPNLDGLEAGFAVPTYRDIRERMKIFEAFSVGQGWNANLTGIGQPERLIASKATAEFFKVYGVQPRLGRTFAPGEDHAGRDKVVVLSYGFWQSAFGGDPQIVGRDVRLDSQPYSVVGVMPQTFTFLDGELVYDLPLGRAA